MIKAFVGITALLIGLTGPQAPAQAAPCQGRYYGQALQACRGRAQMNEIEDRQREIQRQLNETRICSSINGARWAC